MYQPNSFNKRVAFSLCDKSSYPCSKYYEAIGLTSTTSTTTSTIPYATSYALVGDYEIVVFQNNINMTLNHSTSIDNNFILGTIGSGGGGGGGREGASNGGGGGGGFIFASNLILNQNCSFNILSGLPGFGGGSGDSGSSGNFSEIQIQNLSNPTMYIRANGGVAGWRDGGGVGGNYEYDLGNLTDVLIWTGIGGQGGDNSDGFDGIVSTGVNPIPSFLFNTRIHGLSMLYSGGGGGSYDGDETPASAYFSGFPGSNSGIGGNQGSWPKDGEVIDSFQELGVWRGLQGLAPGGGGGAGGAVPSNFTYEDVMTGEPVDWTFYLGGTGGYGLNVGLIKRTNNNTNYVNYNSDLKFIETSSYYCWYASKGIVQFKTPSTITSQHKLTCIMVGGGGGGGASEGGVSCGGGAGGGISYMPYLTLNSNEYLVSVIGSGGKGGVVGNTKGYNGSATYLTYCNSSNTSVWTTFAAGGNGGNGNSAGLNGCDPVEMAGPLWAMGVGKPNIVIDENGVTSYNGVGILYGGNGGDENTGQHGTLRIVNDVNSVTVLPIPQELLDLNITAIQNFYGGGGGGGKASNEDFSYNGGDGGNANGSGGSRGKKEGGGPYEGQKGIGYGGGGGAGGLKDTTEFQGGDGNDGLFLIYMLKTVSSCNNSVAPFSITTNISNSISGFTSDKTYYYSIFTVPGEYNFTINSPSINLNIICVAGGGGGGGGNNGISSGGGGGGGVFLLANHPVGNGNQFISIVGSGGLGGPVESSGTAGGNSYVKTTSGLELINCQGGSPGNANSRGVGGVVLMPTNISTSINGGNGGDQSNGLNSYYSVGSNNSLGIAQTLINSHPTYISNYYSGGGGGGKANNEADGWTGGQGGIGVNSGNGGLRGFLNNQAGSAARGQNGSNYGGGGGAAGWAGEYPGGNGANGIIVIYAKVCQ